MNRGYNPWGCKELDLTEPLTRSLFTFKLGNKTPPLPSRTAHTYKVAVRFKWAVTHPALRRGCHGRQPLG